jgi:hypothetical protein
MAKRTILDINGADFKFNLQIANCKRIELEIRGSRPIK